MTLPLTAMILRESTWMSNHLAARETEPEFDEASGMVNATVPYQ